MKKSAVFFTVVISLFNPLTNRTTLLAIDKHSITKITIGATTVICSLATWHYLNKKIDKLEKLESILRKARGRDDATVQRIKKLVRYKYLSLFASLISFGYVGKQILNLRKNNTKEHIEKERVTTNDNDYELKFESGESWFSYEIFEHSNGYCNSSLISHDLKKTKMPKALESAYKQAWNKSFVAKKDLPTNELIRFFDEELSSIFERESLVKTEQKQKSFFIRRLFLSKPQDF
ncbi:hypothetical protein KAT92_04530 [Candidatus Babeliales bacterium]|nr:hypothetical protein [Candidatus Babeliales bacterium]